MSDPQYNKPVVLTGEEIREGMLEALSHQQKDKDNAPDHEVGVYLEGAIDMLETLLKWMTGQIDKEGNDVSDNNPSG